MTTPSFQDQFAAGAALEYFLHLLQQSSKTPWITEHTTKITVACRVALAFGATIGLSWHYQGGTLTITGLSLTVIGAGLWHLLRQYAVQHGFGKLIRNGNLDAFRQIVLDVVRAELAGQPAAQAIPNSPK
jgi:hypothetical protein